MSAAKHTPGPWKQGFTLSTNVTRRWTAEQRAQNDARERRLVFSNFTSADQGSGRRLIAVCESEEDAPLISAAPELLAALQAEQEWRERDAAGALDPEWDYERMVGDKRRAAISKATGGAA